MDQVGLRRFLFKGNTGNTASRAFLFIAGDLLCARWMLHASAAWSSCIAEPCLSLMLLCGLENLVGQALLYCRCTVMYLPGPYYVCEPPRVFLFHLPFIIHESFAQAPRLEVKNSGEVPA